MIQFGRLPLPPYYAETDLNRSRGELGVFSGCLFITDHAELGVTIWLMKKYGVEDSWTKLFYLGFIIDTRLSNSHCLPLTYMGNGEILMTCGSYVFFYNPVLNSIRAIDSARSYFRPGAIAFRPSLVLLKDSMLGYDVHAKSRYGWWGPVKEKSPQQYGSKALLTNDELPVAGLVEEWVSATSIFSAAVLARQQGSEAPVTGKGLMQNSISVMSAQETSSAALARQQGSKTPVTTDETCVPATRDDPLERIKTVMEEVLEELRKEREQRQELEERLRNEVANVEPLEEQTELLKQQNKQLKERLQDEHAKVKQLEAQIQDSEQLEQENRQMIMQAMDEMKARFMGSH